MSKLNILYLSNKKRWGGILSWMEKTSEGLRQKQHQVWIFSHPKSIFTESLKYKENIISVSFGFDFNPVTILQVVLFIRKHHIDLVVSNIKKEVIVASIACKICKIPHVRRIGTELDYNNKTVQNFYKKGYIQATISPCDFMNDFISNKYEFIKKEEMYRVYNGRNSNKYSEEEINLVKRKYFIDEKKIIIGTLCQLSEVKNIIGVINVFSRLNKEFNNIELVIAGDGPQKEKLLSMVSEMNLAKHVKYIGFVNDSQAVASMYDIGVLFSFKEGFSNTVVEFMSVGTIPLCTNVGGQKEVIKNGVNGFLIEVNDEEALYNRLKDLIASEELRNTMSEKAFNTIRDHFSANKMIDDVEDVYEKVIRRYQAKL